MLLIGVAYVRVKTVNEYLNQTKKDKIVATLVQIFEETISPNELLSYDAYSIEVHEDENIESILIKSIVFDDEEQADNFIKEFGTPNIPLIETHPDVRSQFVAYKSPVIQNATFTVMYRLTVANGGITPEACLLDELESNSPEKIMARKNPNKAFGLVNGEIRELSDVNTNSAHAYWTVNTDWIPKEY